MNEGSSRQLRVAGTLLLLLLSTIALACTPAHAGGPEMEIILGKETYHYCENLSYMLTVSEVTGEIAIVHITDQNAKRSQGIPMPVSEIESVVRAPFPFEREVFPAGTYTINIQYSGTVAEASFELLDTDRVCIPSQIRQVMTAWLSGTLSDGFLLDAIKKSVDDSLIAIPFEIGRENIYEIHIPDWVKYVAHWWVSGMISDDMLAGVFDHLLRTGVIGAQLSSQADGSDAT